MIFVRRRLFFWLLKAYIRKWGKQFFFFFSIGLLVFFLIIRYTSGLISKIPTSSYQSIGIVGDYKINNLPRPILEKISKGLVAVSEDGQPVPSIAKSWKIEDDGKTYVFTLNNNLYFSDGTRVDSSQIEYNFTDATISRPNKDTIVFKLKDSYSPFLITVSRPIFRKGFVGVSDIKIKDVQLNGDFVKSLSLVSTKNGFQTITYHMYPTQNALKLAFLLGEINTANGLTDISYKNLSLDTFPNVEVKKITNNSRLATLFFNAKDPVLSDEKLRNALSYALPDDFF